MRWLEKACAEADPALFEPRDHHDANEWDAIATTARIYCTGCPALHPCGDFADQARDLGLFGGVYRGRRRGNYTRRALVAGAQTPQLPDRRTGVNTGWVA
jgi:hypothetical protein